MRGRLKAALGIAALFAAFPTIVWGAPKSPKSPLVQWTITKDHWDASDEAGFGRFVAGFGEHDCATPSACFRSSANPYRDSDPPELFMDGDCADFIYQLRAYYAWKNGLPFSYALYVMPRKEPTITDNRFTDAGNVITARLQLNWQADVSPVTLLETIGGTVSTAMFRIAADYDRGVSAGDFYPPKIERGAIRPGTAIYDINGHVVYVFKIADDGTIHYVDSNPDRTVTRGTYGPQFPREAPQLGAGFLNFRPIRLVDYVRAPDGSLSGGRFVIAANAEIPDFSTEQYYGNVANPTGDWLKAQFQIDGTSLRFHDYVRRKLARN